MDNIDFSIENPNSSPRIWYWDNDLILMNAEGIAKILSTVSDAIALICFIIVTKNVYRNKKKKENSYIATVLFYSSLFITLARLMEFYYIPSQSDFSNLLNGIGQFYLPFDTYALTLFMIFAIEVFLSDKNEKINWSLFSFINGIFALIIGYLSVLISNGNIIQDIILMVGYIILGINLLVAIIIASKIFKIRRFTDDERTKHLLNQIGILFLMFVFGFIFFLILYLTKGFTGDTLHYQLMIFKNVFYMIIAFYYYKAIIKPGNMK